MVKETSVCGIAGIVDFGGGGQVGNSELMGMLAPIAQRGPDGMETFIDRKSNMCGLAHSRLAVIDVVNGTQPMTNEEGNLWITYNGECYNFRQLRKQLEDAGHRFKTNCDTEVVLHLYEQYGPACVDHIRGMFAFAVWDCANRRLFLARDRLGQKPLYYGIHNGRFIFGSECKAILASDGFPRRADMRSLMQFLLLGYVPADGCAFADVRALPPAHTLTIDSSSYTQKVPRRYWAIPAEASYQGTFEDACDAIRGELAEATRMRMISDVPLGAFLSGGIDSSIVVGLMSQAAERPIKTCSIGFDDRRYNELSYARHAAKRFGCDAKEYMIDQDYSRGIEKLAHYYDEPFADSSALPTCELSLLARTQVTVALTGDGGDECFGGYDRYRAVMLAERVKQSRLLRWLVSRSFWHRIPTGEHHSRLRQLKRLCVGAALPAAQGYLQWISLFDPDMLRDLFAEAHYPMLAETGQWQQLDDCFIGRKQSNSSSDDKTGRSQEGGGRSSEEGGAHPTQPGGSDRHEHAAAAMRFDGEHYLPGDLNRKIDRAAMSVGLELRCPFQDHKVVELAYSLPAGWRHNGSAAKVILRRAFTELLPSRINSRRKMGFGVPVGQLFRKELRALLFDTVLSPRARHRGYFRQDTLERLLSEHQHRREDHGHRLWGLLMLELWHRRYIDR